MTTLKVIKRYHFTELPVPKEIRRAVEKYARRQGMKRRLDFFDRYKNLIPENRESEDSDSEDEEIPQLISRDSESNSSDNDSNSSSDTSENGLNSSDAEILPLLTRGDESDSSISDDNISLSQKNHNTTKRSKRTSITLRKKTQNKHKTHNDKNVRATQEDRLQEIRNNIIFKPTMVKSEDLNPKIRIKQEPMKVQGSIPVVKQTEDKFNIDNFTNQLAFDLLPDDNETSRAI